MTHFITDHQHLLWAQIDAFNASHPVGAPVSFTTGLESSELVHSETVGEAYEEGSRAFVRVKHAAFPVPLTSVKLTNHSQHRW